MIREDSLKLEKVIPTKKQIEVLYTQLKKRSYSISHKALPSFNKHVIFVRNHPYRAWYIIKDNSIDLGNVYVHYDNSIGLSCNEKITADQIKQILMIIIRSLKPLAPKKSVRYGYYFMNIAVKNISLQKKLEKLGLIETQRTYVLDQETLKE